MSRSDSQNIGVYKSNNRGFGIDKNFKIKLEITTSPVISDGVLYVGDAGHYLYALDAKTGKEKWKFRTGGKILSSPAIIRNTVYFGSVDGRLYALDTKTGKEEWRFKSGNDVRSSPVVSNELIYFGSDDEYLYALDLKNGKEKWRFKAEDEIRFSLAFYDGILYFGCRAGYLYAVDAEIGRSWWRVRNGINTSPAVLNNTVFLGSRGSFYALDAKTGEKKWEYRSGMNIISSPTIWKGVVYFGNNNGYIYALDAFSGQKKWKIWIGNEIGPISPTIWDNVIYFGKADRDNFPDIYYLYALNLHEVGNKDSTNRFVEIIPSDDFEESLKEKYYETAGDLKIIAGAIEDFVYDNKHAPKSNSIRELAKKLQPFYIKICPVVDAWGNEFLYKFGGENPKSYWIASAGSDGKFEGFSQKGIYYSGYGEKDIIFSNGKFAYIAKLGR